MTTRPSISSQEISKAIDPPLFNEDNDLNSLVWLSSKEAARYLRKTYGALKTMVSRGHVRARKFRRRLYFKRRELDEILEASQRLGGF